MHLAGGSGTAVGKHPVFMAGFGSLLGPDDGLWGLVSHVENICHEQPWCFLQAGRWGSEGTTRVLSQELRGKLKEQSEQLIEAGSCFQSLRSMLQHMATSRGQERLTRSSGSCCTVCLIPEQCYNS